MSFIKTLIYKLPSKYQYSIHNLAAHPIMELVHLCGYTELGNKIHDATLPSINKDLEPTHDGTITEI